MLVGGDGLEQVDDVLGDMEAALVPLRGVGGEDCEGGKIRAVSGRVGGNCDGDRVRTNTLEVEEEQSLRGLLVVGLDGGEVEAGDLSGGSGPLVEVGSFEVGQVL